MTDKKIVGGICSDHFVMAKVSKRGPHLLAVTFAKRDLVLPQAVGIGLESGFQAASRQHGISAIDPADREKMEEMFRAMQIAAHIRGMVMKSNGLSVVLPGEREGDNYSVLYISKRENGRGEVVGFNHRLDSRWIDVTKPMPYTMAVGLVYTSPNLRLPGAQPVQQSVLTASQG